MNKEKQKTTKNLKGKRKNGILYLDKGVMTGKFLRFNSFFIPSDRVNIENIINEENKNFTDYDSDYINYFNNWEDFE